MRKLILTGKFYLGILLFVSSLIVGKITTITFLLYRDDFTVKLVSIIIYIISWPMLFLGAWLAGREYINQLKKYLSYKYYHRHIREGTKKAIDTSKKAAIKTHGHVSKGTKLFVKTGKGVAIKTHGHVSKGTKRLVKTGKGIALKTKTEVEKRTRKTLGTSKNIVKRRNKVVKKK